MNGVPIEEKYLTEEDFEEQLLNILMKETQIIQRAVYKNQLTDSQVQYSVQCTGTSLQIVRYSTVYTVHFSF